MPMVEYFNEALKSISYLRESQFLSAANIE